jgi:hypothetical protein
MMPLPLVGVWAWLVGLATSGFTSFVGWLAARMVYERAVQIALITAFVVAAAGLTVSLAVSIKAAVFAARMYMPSALTQMTYLLPANFNLVMSLLVTLRVSTALYRWTVTTMGYYVPKGQAGYGGLM